MSKVAEDGRETYAFTPAKGEVLAPQPRHATCNYAVVGCSQPGSSIENFQEPCLKSIATVSRRMVVAILRVPSCLLSVSFIGTRLNRFSFDNSTLEASLLNLWKVYC